MVKQIVIIDVEDLPDGRRLLVLENGDVLVAGKAQPRPHPIPGFEWLVPPGGRVTPKRRPATRPRSPGLPRFSTAPTVDRSAPGPRDLTEAAIIRAEQLLDSLLTPSQFADRQFTGCFWVDTPRGPVRLGHLYAIRHFPINAPNTERILCAVPVRHLELPPADIWANLLLMIAVEPDAFFDIAVLVKVRRRDQDR